MSWFTDLFSWLNPTTYVPTQPTSEPPVSSSINYTFTNFITPENLQILAPNVSAADIASFVSAFNSILPVYDIIEADQFALFLSQVLYESNYMTELEENLHYSAKRLMQVWPSKFNSSNANTYAENPEMIANRAYANIIGNGNEASGDGWTYRGRGLIQLTGKDNYNDFASAVGKSLSDAVAYAASIPGAVESAAWFYYEHNLEQYTSESDVTIVTRIISGSTSTVSDRKELFVRVQPLVQPNA